MSRRGKDPVLTPMTTETQEFYWVNGTRFEDRVAAERKRTEVLIVEKFDLMNDGTDYQELAEWITKNPIWVIEVLQAMIERTEAAG